MNFVSIQFLIFIFLVTLAYFLVPRKKQWYVLLISSYIYFFINSEWLILVLFGQTFIAFLTGIYLEKQTASEKNITSEMKATLTREEKKNIQTKIRKKKNAALRIGISLDLFALIFLKYYNFFTGSVSFFTRKFGISFPSLNLLLPIGISFYTLQAIAYMVDVSHGKIHADTSLPKFMLFMSYFPQIAQGPIPRHKQLANQLYESHDFVFDRIWKGVQLIIWGYMKKMIIADRIMIPVDTIFNNHNDYQGFILFFGAAAYWLQLYADFSGGIDIARGFSQMIGINLEMNFTQPYFAISVEDFWRRWHRTLGGFMRDYVFYPLSLSLSFSRFGKYARKLLGENFGRRIPPFISMFLVYLLVGLWHGPRWKYAVFGIWNGMFIACGILLTDVFVHLRQYFRIHGEKLSWRLFQMIQTFIIISIGSFFSRADGLNIALTMIRDFLKKWYDFAFLFDGTMSRLGISSAEWTLLLLMVILLASVDLFHEKKISVRDWVSGQGIVFEILLLVAAISAIIIFGVYGPGYDASRFIYQQF